MVVPLDREHLIAAVERSPQAAAAHDRAGWVGLFTADARVEDPVGSRPHLGPCCAISSSKWRWVRP
jgi:hypothetical protein